MKIVNLTNICIVAFLCCMTLVQSRKYVYFVYMKFTKRSVPFIVKIVNSYALMRELGKGRSDINLAVRLELGYSTVSRRKREISQRVLTTFCVVMSVGCYRLTGATLSKFWNQSKKNT